MGPLVGPLGDSPSGLDGAGSTGTCTQSDGPTRINVTENGGTRAESDGSFGLDGAGSTGTCTQSDGPSRGFDCAVHLGISAESDGPNGDNVADKRGAAILN
jgi:hypothetical protein